MLDSPMHDALSCALNLLHCPVSCVRDCCSPFMHDSRVSPIPAVSAVSALHIRAMSNFGITSAARTLCEAVIKIAAPSAAKMMDFLMFDLRSINHHQRSSF